MGQIIGLLGGVASGKSTVGNLLRQAGWLVLDGDEVARQVVSEPAVAQDLADRFGNDLFDDQGTLDRALLAKRAFAEAQSTADLNAIVHPAVRQRLLAQLDQAGSRDVALDIPLLLESPLAVRVDQWVFIATDEKQRDEWAEGRQWEPGERSRRESRQATLAEKRAAADHVLVNDGTIDDLKAQVEALLRAWAATVDHHP
ncbi:MAG: dephospho-CoA kinase [Pseudohongiellaceae bacterium]|jgi:dephospho-CoA kinase